MAGILWRCVPALEAAALSRMHRCHRNHPLPHPSRSQDLNVEPLELETGRAVEASK